MITLAGPLFNSGPHCQIVVRHVCAVCGEVHETAYNVASMNHFELNPRLPSLWAVINGYVFCDKHRYEFKIDGEQLQWQHPFYNFPEIKDSI